MNDLTWSDPNSFEVDNNLDGDQHEAQDHFIEKSNIFIYGFRSESKHWISLIFIVSIILFSLQAQLSVLNA